MAQGAFALIGRLSPPGAGLVPYRCHRLATSLVARILLYGADLFTPNVGSLARLDTFWQKVQWWATNCFSSTPIGILAIESCLPPIPLLVSQRQRLAALRTVCSPPGLNPATARLHTSFPSLSSYQESHGSRARTKGLLSVYLPLTWMTRHPSPLLRKHLPIDAVAHRPIAFTGGLSRVPMINTHLVPEVLPNLPLQSLMESTYSALKKRVRQALIEDWSQLFPTPAYYHHPPVLHPRPFMGLGKFIVGRIHQMRAGKSYLAAHSSWRAPEADTSCPRCGLEPESFEHAILTCPSRQGACTRLLHGVTDVGHEAPLWSSLPLLKRLATYISVTSMGLPPTMSPPTTPTTPPSSPPFPLAPPNPPPPVFRVFSLAEA